MKNKCSVQKLLLLLMVGLFFLPVLAADIAAGTGPAGQDHDPAQTSLEVTYNLSGKLHDISKKGKRKGARCSRSRKCTLLNLFPFIP
jgi:hypothetical protein